MSRSRKTKTGVYQWIVLPNTGIQICRGFPITERGRTKPEALWKLAEVVGRRFGEMEIIRLISDHIACNQELDATPWIPCDENEFVFFRLTRAGADMQLDLVADTRNGAGAQAGNKIPVLMQSGLIPLRKRAHLADIYVEEHQRARNEIGSLIMDFGNSGSAFIFSRGGAGPIQARMVQPANPFDPRYRERSADERNILRSNMIVLRVGPNGADAPWIVLGKRSEELIQDHPLATYLYAPKKYVRFWPEHLRAPEPTMKFRGILGQRDGLHPMLEFVGHTLDQMLQQVLASLTNPHGTSDEPEFYPQISRVMLTYPLTWRAVDRELFQGMIEGVTDRLLVHEAEIQKQFQVELVCSEPVAVAAYVLWETFFHFGTANLDLAASSLGNTRGGPELRLLIVDIGGGSTDIACVEIGWKVRQEDESVDVTFKLLESMRFNRAGDRLSHVIATGIREFLREKYGIVESLDFKLEAQEPAFTRVYKRLAVSKISELAEAAKAHISGSDEPWVLAQEEEYDLVRRFEPLLKGIDFEAKTRMGPRMYLDAETLRTWVMADRQSLETNGEPGFMDIFLYLEELRYSLKQKGRDPHMVVMSGRTTRLPFLKRMCTRYTNLPPHRIRTLRELLPDELKLQGYANMDKLAVVCGAQRFRFGDHIRFVSLPDSPIFNRYIGTVRETPTGLRLNKILIRPGDTQPRTITVPIDPARDVRIGHAFREDGSAQVIANLSNNSPVQHFEIELDILDDYTVSMAPHDHVLLTEWVPGGNDFIVDNFNDTGGIDGEPEGFLTRIVLGNKDRWLHE